MFLLSHYLLILIVFRSKGHQGLPGLPGSLGLPGASGTQGQAGPSGKSGLAGKQVIELVTLACGCSNSCHIQCSAGVFIPAAV